MCIYTYFFLLFVCYNNLPAGRRNGRQLVRVPVRRRRKMKKKIITPIQHRSFLDSHPAAVSFIRSRRVRVFLLILLRRRFEEPPPHISHLLHHLRLDSVVYHLKNPPLSTSLRYLSSARLTAALVAAEQLAEVHGRDFDRIVGGGGPRRRRSDVPVWDCVEAGSG